MAVPAVGQSLPGGGTAYNGPRIDSAVNPEFSLYEEQIAPDPDHNLGYIPPALDLSYLKDEAAAPNGMLVASAFLPASYMVPVSSVRDQTYWGTCWAFGTYGSLESTLLVGGGAESDFSEKNMVNRAGFDAASSGVENTGGNYIMSTAYLARWDGPVSEADDPYPTDHTWSGSPGTYTIQEHLRDVYFIPGISGSPPNVDSIKNALLDYGAVYTSINTSYIKGLGPMKVNYNPARYAYYNPNSANVTDHGVTIVGWDDNFLASNFTPAAPGNGAFIVKNSWGPGWGNNGFFYISYYDAKVGQSNAVFIADPVTSADHIYQYDRLGLVGFGGYYYTNLTPCETNWMANVFRAGSNEQVTNVSFYARYPGMQYVVYIYTDPAPGNPSSGTLAVSQSGTLAQAGYNMVDIASQVTVGAGHNFSAIVKLKNPLDYRYNYNVPHCFATPLALTSNATATPDTGYISPDGVAWEEITRGYGEPSISNCLKAFTRDADPGPALTFRSDSCAVFENNGTVTLTVDKVGASSDTVSVRYGTSNGTALSGVNYLAPSPNPSTLSIGPSESSGNITIPILDDGIYGAPKTFSVTLSSPLKAHLGDISQATVTIVDQDPAPAISLESSGKAVGENAGAVNVSIIRENDSSSPVSVYWSTAGGNPGLNYTPRNGSVTFSRGEFSKQVQVPIIDDHIYGSVPATFYVNLSSPTGGAVLKAPVSMAVTVNDADPAPVLRFEAADYYAGTGDGSLTVNVTRLNDAYGPVTVTYNTSDGTAVKGQNYADTNGTLTFSRGEMRHSICIPIIPAGLSGSDVTFNVTLSNPTGGATLGTPGKTMVTISESSFSYTYDLVTGWNLIAVPLNVPDNTIDGFFPADAKGEIVDLWGWNSTAQWWTYYSPDPNTPFVGYEPIATMDAGRAYWANMNNSVSFTIHGVTPARAPNETVPFVSSWNFVGLTGLTPVASDVMYPASVDVWGWNSTAGWWTYYSPDPNTPFVGYEPLTIIRPGEGLWVNI